MDKPETIAIVADAPEDVKTVDGFCQMNDSELRAFRAEMGFAMSEEDLFFVRQHYSEDLLRDPTVTELRVIDTYWSDHCRHTTFSTEITDVTFGTDKYSQLLKKAYDRYLEIRKEVYGERIAEKDITLMDLAVIGTKYVKKLGLADDLDESEEINACSINVTAEIDGKKEDWLVMFENGNPQSSDGNRTFRRCGYLSGRSDPRSAFRACRCVPSDARDRLRGPENECLRYAGGKTYLSGKSPPERRTATVPTAIGSGIATGKVAGV